MANLPLKTIIVVGLVAAAGTAAFFKYRRVPACSEDGKYMSTVNECQAWGIDTGVCAQAVEKARAAVSRAAPRTETMFQCELRFSDCFENPAGGFSPKPSFCLRQGGEPTEIRYLEYESDRRNRKKTKEVRVD